MTPARRPYGSASLTWLVAWTAVGITALGVACSSETDPGQATSGATGSSDQPSSECHDGDCPSPSSDADRSSSGSSGASGRGASGRAASGTSTSGTTSGTRADGGSGGAGGPSRDGSVADSRSSDARRDGTSGIPANDAAKDGSRPGDGASDPRTDAGCVEGNPALCGTLAAHNDARSNVNPPASTPIPALVWDATVAASAQAYAAGCHGLEHTPEGQRHYGENIYATTGTARGTDATRSWVGEQKWYDYAANQCSTAEGAMCGHYTQVVWRSSLRVGCGVQHCTTNSPFTGSSTYELVICQYDPAGNVSPAKNRPY